MRRFSLTCELLAERRGDGGGPDQRRLADVLQVLDLGDAVVVDEVVVFLGGGERAVDLVAQVLDADVLVVAGRHSLHQLPRVLGARREVYFYFIFSINRNRYRNIKHRRDKH